MRHAVGVFQGACDAGFLCCSSHRALPAPSNALLLRCVTPPGVGAGVSIRVNASSILSQAKPLWTYDPPIIEALHPSVLLPAGGELLTITGSSFGGTRATGLVTVGGRPCTQSAADTLPWNDTSITCVAPPGVTAAALVVRAADLHRVARPSVYPSLILRSHSISFTGSRARVERACQAQRF